MVTIVTRAGKGSPLTNTEVDSNFTNLAAETVDVQTHAATSKATPVDADEVPLSDSAATYGLKKLTWANLKAAITGVGALNSGSITSGFGAIDVGADAISGGTITGSNDASLNGLTVGRGAGAVSTNTAVGASALAANTSGAYSTAFGTNALTLNQGGNFNTALGWGALQTNVSGHQNTAVGQGALALNTADYNTAVGRSTLNQNSSGVANTAIGREALYSNTTASNNTAVGYQAGYSNTTGYESVAMGYHALFGGTVGRANVAIGFESMVSVNTGDFNTAIGGSSLTANTSGTWNAAIGKNTLLSNSSGSYNTAVGGSALNSNTTASYNTAVGYQAGYSNTLNAGVTAVGYRAGYANTTGSLDAFGYSTLAANTTGTNNVAFGYYSMPANTTGSNNTAIGVNALVSNTTASNNTAVGYQAGYSNTIGQLNTYIGYCAGKLYNRTSNDDSGNTFVGYNAGHGDGITTPTGQYNVLLGSSVGFNLTSGSFNTFVGNGSSVPSGYYMTTGSKNTILGGFSGNQHSLDIRTANNYIVLSDGDGNPRQVIDGSGNVGIGTVSPGEKLDVKGGFVQVTDTTGSGGYRIRMGVGGPSGTPSSLAYIEARDSLPLGFYTSSTERARIDSSGNLHITTASSVLKFTATGSPTGIEFYGTGKNTISGPGSGAYIEHQHSGDYLFNSNQIYNIGSSGVMANLVYTTGVAFPATQVASANANTLDDYEEGTWTPTINLLGTLTYSQQKGWYVKVGKLVTIGCYLTVSSTDTTQDGSAMIISGLPYIHINDSRASSTACCLTERMSASISPGTQGNTFHVMGSANAASINVMQNSYDSNINDASYYSTNTRAGYAGGNLYIQVVYSYEANA